MDTCDIGQTVGEIVAKQPRRARVFEKAGIDYCCGGKTSLQEACRRQGLDPNTILAELQQADRAEAAGGPPVDPATMTLTELADHIEATHHAYLRHELPRLVAMTGKVAFEHGAKDRRLYQVCETFLALATELSSHMRKEEQILFPLVRMLEKNAQAPRLPCGSLAGPVQQMELEHDDAGSALEKLRESTDRFAPPDWACNTYRAMLDALAHLEQDLHMHIHKENNVLFPRALELEALKLAAAPVT